MASDRAVGELIARLKALSCKTALTSAELGELQQLAARAADVVCAAETVRSEARAGSVTLLPAPTMRAIRYERFGDPSVLGLQTVAVPEPNPLEVLIKVRAAGVNPVDWKIREGRYPQWVELPAIPGGDVAGQIAVVGKAVTGWQVGQGVFGDIRRGAYAEYAVAEASLLAPKPQHLDYVQAAAVPLAAMTAWQGLFDSGGLKPGQTVLVHGASGGVGHLAVQLARWKGARVVGTASSAHAEAVRELGADQVVEYDRADFEREVRDVDLVLDLVGDRQIQEKSLRVLRKGGILVSAVSSPPTGLAEELGVRATHFVMEPSGRLLVEIGRLFDSGAIRAWVWKVLPLEQAARAHEISQQGHALGKIVLTID